MQDVDSCIWPSHVFGIARIVLPWLQSTPFVTTTVTLNVLNVEFTTPVCRKYTLKFVISNTKSSLAWTFYTHIVCANSHHKSKLSCTILMRHHHICVWRLYYIVHNTVGLHIYDYKYFMLSHYLPLIIPLFNHIYYYLSYKSMNCTKSCIYYLHRHVKWRIDWAVNSVRHVPK